MEGKNCYFYRFDAATKLGRDFRRLWHWCINADRARERFKEKVGAVAYCPDEQTFAGGVVGVFFADDAKVDNRMWQACGKADDGTVCWVPICKRRRGTIVLKEGQFRPSDTATRIYDRAPITGKDGKTLYGYTELYRDDAKCKPKDKRRKMPYHVRKSIRIEKARMTLPVVRTETILGLLGADLTCGKGSDGKPYIVRLVTPVFFEYEEFFYVGVAYPCHADGIEEIGAEAYSSIKSTMLKVMRAAEALKD